MSVSPAQGQAWVLIESGSNQDFIFQSNRQHFHVGASDVLKRIPLWVDRAVKEATVDPEAVVIKTSSKAMLLVEDVETGRRIVTSVTSAALREAPGLDIWGVVEDALIVGDPMDPTRIEQLHRRHAITRWQRPTPRQREPLHPFTEICAVTGRPATNLVPVPGNPQETMAVSRLTGRVFDVAQAARARMAGEYGDAVLEDLTVEVVNAGWVAVVHADGNGVGDLIKHINGVDEYRRFSEELEGATREAFTEAIDGVDGRDWLVPLIIGGDDITVLCDASRAVDLTRSFLTCFEKATASRPTLSAVSKRATGRTHLTASAGIAAVKPRYPFHAAYELAAELATSAKDVKRLAEHRSSYDFHVLHDSVNSSLANIRAKRPRAVQWWVGPLLAPRGAASAAPPSSWEIAHEDAPVLAARDALAGPRDLRPLSDASLHELRAAILAGPEDVDRIESRLRSRRNHKLDTFLADHLNIGQDDGDFTRVLTVMDLADILLGRAEGERQQVSKKRQTRAKEGRP